MAVDPLHQDVVGLEVAMDDTTLVRVVHRVADVGQQLQRRRVGAVEIVDDQKEGLLGAELEQQPRHLVEHQEAFGRAKRVRRPAPPRDPRTCC